MTWTFTLFLAISTYLFVGLSAADAGDAAYGEYLASECATCHRQDGAWTNIPDITGWPEEAFVEVLMSYKTKERENPVMQTIAAALGEEEMRALAAYYKSLGKQ